MVGNFVSSHALAAVGQSTSIINMLVGFFMGLSTGAGVVIAQYFGAKETKKDAGFHSYIFSVNFSFMRLIHNIGYCSI